MRRRTYTTRLLASLAALTLAITACGGGDGGTPTDDDGGTADGADDGEGAAGEPQQGGTIVVQQPFDACCGTPFGSQDPSVMQIFSGTVYSKLIDFDTDSSLDAPELVPDLAESWEVSEDGLTYTFDLRDDVTWHDIEPVSGRPFVADDVVANFERLAEGTGRRYEDDEEGSMIYPHSYMLGELESVEAPDDTTVVFTLAEPYGPFLLNMAHHFNFIMPREAIDWEIDPNETWIGTGPFMVESYSPDTEWVLERNPDYFVDGLPYLDRIELPILSDWAAVSSALRSGRLDLAETTSSQSADEISADPQLEVFEQSDLPITFFLNMGEEPFDDLRVRQAIMMAVDWEAMGESIRGQVTNISYVRPEHGAAALTEEEVAEIRVHDPDRARELLEEAGFPDGFSTTLLVQQLGDDDVREGQWIVQDLAEVGIDAEIEITDPGTAVQRRRDFQFEMHKAARSVHLPDQVWMDFMPGALDNHTQIDDDELTGLFEQSRAALDDDERNDLYRQMQERMETEIASVLYPYHYTRYTVANSRIQGLETSFIYHGGRYAQMWVED